MDEFSHPPDSKWGDLTYPCFGLSKGMGKPPAEIAAELAPKIEAKGFITKVEARGPYINFFTNAKILAEQTLQEIEALKEKYGAWSLGSGKRVMVEYAQPNTHKAIHVGHLRNFVLGQTIINVLKVVGYEVVAASYHGDTGTHVATALWGLQKFHQDEEPPKKGRGEWLGKIYAEATAWVEEHPEDKDQVAEVAHRLAAGDKALTKLWKKTRQWSIGEFDDVFKELGLEIKKKYYESEMDEPGRKMVAELLQKGIVKESEGALVVPLDECGLGTFLVLKSDGGTLYATRDLALAHRKFTDYKIDRSVAVVDGRQSLYFKQLFKTLEIAGFKKPMVHVPYEFVTLKEGAMSSRKGTIITYEEFRDEVTRVAADETKKRHENWSDKKIQKQAKSIAMAAMKIGMLAQDVARPIIFDVKTATSFDGFTGPYLQYTGARVAGILRKVRRGGGKGMPKELTPEERKLAMVLAQYPAVVLKASQDLRPAPLVEYLFGLAKSFAEFYEKAPVLKAEPTERAFRVRLVCAVGTVMKNAGQLLGIEIPQEM